MIVEAIRTDLYTGPHELRYAEHSRYKCVRCPITYEFLVHGTQEEFVEVADPVPPHFERLSDRIDTDHDDGHRMKAFASDGTGEWTL